MTASKSWLCIGCPGKNNPKVDYDVNGSCPADTVDSFRQARSWSIEDPEDRHMTAEEVATNVVSNGVRYFENGGDVFERPADWESAHLGALCARRFLDGDCPKTLDQIIEESEVY